MRSFVQTASTLTVRTLALRTTEEMAAYLDAWLPRARSGVFARDGGRDVSGLADSSRNV